MAGYCRDRSQNPWHMRMDTKALDKNPWGRPKPTQRCSASKGEDSVPHACYFSGSYYRNNIYTSVQIIKLLILQFSPSSCYLLSIRFKYYLQQPVLKHPHSICFSSLQRQTKFHRCDSDITKRPT